ncbi:MAG: arsenate reductase family protein [Aequorivita sp.]
MGQIARDDRQLTLIYSSNTRVGTHTLSYLTGMDGRYLAIDLAKTKVADTQWAEIADALGVKIGDLVDKRELDIDSEATENFDSTDWLKIIQNNDSVISRPIVIMGKRTKQIDNPPEIMEFFQVDSAGLEQSPSNGADPDLERTSEDETFIEKNEE